MTRLALTLILAVAAAAVLAATGGARQAATNAFLCPQNPAAKPSALWVKNVGPGFRGSTWCNDGATAKLTLKATPQAPGVPPALSFSGGLCTQLKDGSRYLQIGTRISPSSKRKSTDPKGLFLNRPNNTNGGGPYLDLGTPTFRWADDVKISWAGLTGTYSGSSDMWVNDVFTTVKVTGSFSCKRIVKTSL